MNTTVTPAEDSSDLRLVIPGRGTPAGSGWNWLKGGWALFIRAPLMWIISLVLIFVCVVALALVPFLGQLAVNLLQPVILAGYMIACRSLERGGDFELDHLLGGFKKNFGNLVIVGVIFVIGEVVILLFFLASSCSRWVRRSSWEAPTRSSRRSWRPGSPSRSGASSRWRS